MKCPCLTIFDTLPGFSIVLIAMLESLLEFPNWISFEDIYWYASLRSSKTNTIAFPLSFTFVFSLSLKKYIEKLNYETVQLPS